MTHLITPYQRNLLVYGYIRQNVLLFITLDLQKLCHQYYNDIVDWTLTNDELQQFFSKKYNEIVYGPKFYITDIPFQLISYPRGCKHSSNEGFVNLYIQLLSDDMPEDITQFNIYGNLFCSVTKIQWKKGITLRYIRNTAGKRTGWFRYNMELEQYKECESITFCCYTELTDIKRRINEKVIRHKIVNMKLKSIYQWDIDCDTLNAFKTANSGQCYYSPNFNGCFCIIVIPKGRVTDQFGSFRAFVKLLKLPIDISSIDVECTLQVITDNEENQMEYSFSEKLGFMRRQSVASSTLFYEPNDDIFDEKVSIKATLEVKTLYDYDRIIIDENKWNELNVTLCDD